MTLNSIRLWALSAAGGVVVIFGALWLLAISPTLAQASTIRTEAESVLASNETREATLVALKKDFENISALRADLAALRSALPAQAEVPDFLRQLQDAAARNQVTLTGVSVQTPESVVDPATVDPAATEAAADAATTTASSGLVQIPVAIEASGERANLDTFLAEVQEDMERLVLVDAVTEARSDQQGTPPYTDTITGRLLVLQN